MVAVPASTEALQDHDPTRGPASDAGVLRQHGDPEPFRARGCLYPGVPALRLACPEGIDRRGAR